MLKTSSAESAKPKKGRIGVGDNSKARCDGRCKLNERETGNNKVHNKVDDEVDDKVGKKSQKTSKFKNLFQKLSKSKKTVGSDFFILRARLAFTELRQAFVKALILHYFDPKCHIRGETDVLGYAINRILS